MEATTISFEQRLSKLERANRTWRLLALFLAVAFGLSLACSERQYHSPEHQLGQANAALTESNVIYDKLRVRHLEIFNEADESVGGLGPSYLVLRSPNGEGSFQVWILPDYQSVSLGTEWNTMQFTPQGANLRRYTPEQLRLSKSLQSRLMDEQNKPTTEEMQRAQPNTVLELGIAEGGGGLVDVYNSLGTKVVSLQANKRNEGALYLRDVAGEIRAGY